MNDRCVCCGEIIPEGRMVCPSCEKKKYDNNKDSMKKICPLTQNFCKEFKCGWWCSWSECCAMIAIPAEISDRISDLQQTINQ